MPYLPSRSTMTSFVRRISSAWSCVTSVMSRPFTEMMASPTNSAWVRWAGSDSNILLITMGIGMGQSLPTLDAYPQAIAGRIRLLFYNAHLSILSSERSPEVDVSLPEMPPLAPSGEWTVKSSLAASSSFTVHSSKRSSKSSTLTLCHDFSTNTSKMPWLLQHMVRCTQIFALRSHKYYPSVCVCVCVCVLLFRQSNSPGNALFKETWSGMHIRRRHAISKLRVDHDVWNIISVHTYTIETSRGYT